MISLIVSLNVIPQARDQFLAGIDKQRTATLREEPGCLHFDVCVDQADPNHFLLYEIYADEAALANHRETDHFATWRRTADTCVASQTSTPTDLVLSDAGRF